MWPFAFCLLASRSVFSVWVLWNVRNSVLGCCFPVSVSLILVGSACFDLQSLCPAAGHMR